MLAEEKAECERDVSRLDIKLFASKQEIEDLQEKLEIASMNQSLLEKEREGSSVNKINGDDSKIVKAEKLYQ